MSALVQIISLYQVSVCRFDKEKHSWDSDTVFSFQQNSCANGKKYVN